MRIRNFLLLPVAVLLLLLSFSLANCKKSDQSSPSEVQEPEATSQVATSEFFQHYGTLDVLTSAIRTYVIREDVKYHFSEEYLQKAGRPIWNKALTFTNSSAQTSSSTGTPATSSITYVPLVDDDKFRVNAALVVKIIGSDTIPAMLYAQQYARYGFTATPSGQWNARNVFHMFALLDHAVYSTQKFVVTDKRLLTDDQKNAIQQAKLDIDKVKITYTMQETAQQQVGVQYAQAIDVCNTFTYCVEYQTFRGAVSTLTQPAPCLEWGSETLCTTYWFNIPGGGSNGGTNDGGGTGSGGSGGSGGGGGDPWAPVPDPCTPPSEARGTMETLDSEECDPAWHPLWEAQMLAYQSILLPGESFDFNVAPNGYFDSYSTIADFESFKNAVSDISNTTYDLSIPETIINQQEKLKTARYNLNFVGGIDIDLKLEKVDNLWKIKEVESDTWGFTPSVSWKQSQYGVSLSGNAITLEVKGKLSYNVVWENIGTIYKQDFRFRVILNNITGEITGISRF